MHPGRFFGALALAGAWLLGPSAAWSDPAPVKHVIVPYALESGVLVNRAATESEIYSEVVQAGDVPWMRLGFGSVRLAPGSRLQMTSLLDGGSQTLTATTLAQWHNTSAYFNGSAVRVTLIAAAGSQDNAVEIDRLIVGEVTNSTESQCGPTDDRVPSAEPARARLLSGGCTASIYNDQSCFISAGHCNDPPSIAGVVEFQVPPSLANGTIVHPGPEDQYSVTNERQSVNGGIGNDWFLFKVFPNTQTGLMPFEAQGAALTFASSLPPVNTTLRIVGYGVDSGTRNQTQQVNTGPLTSISGTTLRYQVDTEGGNSGSAVTLASTDEVIGIHTNAGCDLGNGSNSGTAITNPGLQGALQTFCTEDGGITCAEVSRLTATCSANRRVTVQVRMTDTSNSGQTVVAAIDGSPINVALTLQGGLQGRAGRRVASGLHTVTLVDPAGCTNVPAVQVTCP